MKMIDSSFKPTLIERFVQLIPLRYPLALLAWVIILGQAGFGLANYIETGASPLYLPNPINAFFGFLLYLYLFYVVRYLRLRVMTAESSIAPIMSCGEGEYHSVFRRLNSTWPILLLTLILEALTGPATKFSDFTLSSIAIYNQITRVFVLLGFSTLVWEYSVSSWGLHRLGESNLRLKSFMEDRFMGARSIGNVALSLTFAYLAGLLLFFLDSATFIALSPEFVGFFLILLALGVIMFFLPLNSLHRKMQAEKSESLHALAQKLPTKEFGAMTSNGPAQSENPENGIKELVRLKNLEIIERRLA